MAETVPICQRSGSTTVLPGGSVATVALFAPWVAMVVIAKRLPEARVVLRQQPQSSHPLRALPEVEVRNHQARWAAVGWLQRLSVVRPGDERLAVQDISQRQVRGVATVRVGDHEPGGGVQFHRLEERVHADAG